MSHQHVCNTCKAEMQLVRLEPFTGEEGDVRLTLRNMPALVCPEHHKRFVNAADAPKVMDGVLDTDNYGPVASATPKGWFKKHWYCADCAKELPESPDHAEHREIPVKLSDDTEVTAEVEFKVYRCSGCGKEQVHSVDEEAQRAFKAVAHAYRAIDIHAQ